MSLYPQRPPQQQPQQPVYASPKVPKFGQSGYSGLDNWRRLQQGYNPLVRAQAPASYLGYNEEQQEVNPGGMPISERRATSAGRGRNSLERIDERALRLQSRILDRQLSPFAQSFGMPQPQQMARNSIFGAMQPGLRPLNYVGSTYQ